MRTLAAGALLGALAPFAYADDSTTARNALTDDELIELARGEVVEVFAERPDKPFDRDTEVRLTGAELAARGAVDLATALALLPDVNVRDAGRGGFNIDIRGGRKGAVSIFIDGVQVSDPFYGTFDVSSIPITDIVQIRVATTPQSPIDGPGGPGGVIEVHTRDAIGPQLVIARLTGDSLPSFGLAGTARAALANHLALRLAGSGLAGARDFALPMEASVGESRRAATGAARLEYRRGERRIALDGFVDDRHYIAPPSADTADTVILMVDRETTTRATIKADDRVGSLQLQAQSWVHSLKRRSRTFGDARLANDSEFFTEDLAATRVGGMALATAPLARDFRWAASATIDRESARVASSSAAEMSAGDVTLGELAVDGQYERKRLRVDAAIGAALPVGLAGTSPWPEGKLVGKYRWSSLELTATAAYKGRVPTLRERFDSTTGNPKLGPELTRHGELRVVWERPASEPATPRLRLELAPFIKHTVGASRICTTAAQCPDGEVGRLFELEDTLFYGVDAAARVPIVPQLEVGAAYSYVKACELDSPRGCGINVADMGGADPLDRLPRHRGELWGQWTPDPRVAARLRVRHVGAAFDKRVETPSYQLVEANITAQLSKAYLAVLRIDDALNVRPETRTGFRAPGRVISLVVQGTWE